MSEPIDPYHDDEGWRAYDSNGRRQRHARWAVMFAAWVIGRDNAAVKRRLASMSQMELIDFEAMLVPVGQVVIEALARHLAAYPAREVEMVDRTGRRPVTRKARPVFTDHLGRALRRNDFNRDVWGPAREAAGVPESTQHDLRHFYASLLIRAGLSVKAVAKLLGHGSPAETLKTYARMWPDDEDRSRDAVDAVLRRADAPTARPSLEA